MGNGADGLFLPRVPFRELDPAEALSGVAGQTVVDYWRWAYSDILENIQRGIFAEFLVAAALGVTSARRVGWAGYDVDYDGFKIEVKSSAYLQGWNQRALTKPIFGIGTREQLDDAGIAYDSDPRYVADCFVFCLFADTDPPTARILGRCALAILRCFYLATHRAMRIGEDSFTSATEHLCRACPIQRAEVVHRAPSVGSRRRGVGTAARQ